MSASVFFIDLFARLRLPNKLTIHADQAAGLKAVPHSFEFLARALRITIEHPLAVKLFAPSGELHDHSPRRQLQAWRRWCAAAGRTFVERRKSQLLPQRKLACCASATKASSVARTSDAWVASPWRRPSRWASQVWRELTKFGLNYRFKLML